MPRRKRLTISDLSIADLKRLLATKEKTAGLEEKKAKLEKDLAAVDARLAKLASGKPAVRRGRKPGRKPGRPAAKKAGRRLAKKVQGRAAKKATPKRGRTPGIQDVVVALIRENGKPMGFQDILAAIQQRKLVTTKSKNFANVLRRTLSTSTQVKRVARGTYDARR